MARYEHSGSAQDAHLIGKLSATGLGLTIDAFSGWPTGSTNKFWIAIDPDTASEEHILVNTRASGGLTIASIGDRGLEGTAPVEHDPGAVVRHIFSATEATDMALQSAANTFTAQNVFTVGLQGTADDHYFGANAAGATGTRIHLGSLSDLTAAHINAEGSPTNVDLTFRFKGAAHHYFQNAVSANLMVLDNAPSANDTVATVNVNGVGDRRIVVGAADSGGTGFRMLRIAN